MLAGLGGPRCHLGYKREQQTNVWSSDDAEQLLHAGGVERVDAVGLLKTVRSTQAVDLLMLLLLLPPPVLLLSACCCRGSTPTCDAEPVKHPVQQHLLCLQLIWDVAIKNLPARAFSKVPALEARAKVAHAGAGLAVCPVLWTAGE